MNKIIMRARGGLGNQLFQYSYAFALQKANPDYKIIVDAKEYSKYYWPFQLDEYEFDNTEIYYDKKFKCDFSMKVFHVYQRLYSALKNHTYNTSKRLIKKGKLYTGTFSPEIRKYGGRDIYMYGYFQDAGLLTPIREELAQAIKLKNVNDTVKSYIEKMKEEAVSVSIRVARREEIENGEKFIYDGADYYKKCLNAIKQKRGKVQPVIFSNNIDLIKEEKWFDDVADDILYVENCSATEQLELMTHCRDFIMANSTFSWWGAFLGSTGKDSIIYSPRIWYTGSDIDDTKLQFPGLLIYGENGEKDL